MKLISRILQFSGSSSPIIDCNTLDRFKSPPCSIPRWGGNHPYVCCPEPKRILFPGDPGTESFVPGDYDYDGLSDGCDEDNFIPFGQGFEGAPDDFVPTDEFKSPSPCIGDTSCVFARECGPKDFSNSTPPTYCKLDKATGQDKFCCSDVNDKSPDALANPRPPQFPRKDGQARPCQDHTPLCKKWARDHPESCQAGHKSYKFMREACHESCGRCGNVGCVDVFELCPQWSRSGQCSIQPRFMAFYCRESCGTCGFKSPFETDKQVDKERHQYSDLKSSDFFCGQLKPRETIENNDKPFNFDDKVEENVKRNDSVCTSAVFSDRFVVTAAHCIAEFKVKNQNQVTRNIFIRDNTPFKEIIEVKREFSYPLYNFPLLYYDIAIFELERKIEYDYEKYGDSPTCMGQALNIAGQEAIGQGFGITETGGFPENLLEAKVEIIDNQDCQDWLNANATDSPNRIAINLKRSYPEGFSDSLMCSIGIFNPEKKIFSVSSFERTFFFDIRINISGSMSRRQWWSTLYHG